MSEFRPHHVSLTTRNLKAARSFFTDVLGFEEIPRPNFPIGGTWLKAGGVEIHLTDFPQGSFRNTREVGTDDVHFAIRVGDFEGMISKLANFGYKEGLNASDNKKIIVKRQSLAGYSQLYIMTPDNHLIEINAAY